MIDIMDQTGELCETYIAAIENAAKTTIEIEGRSGDANICIETEDEIQRLNRDYRDKDSVTDVLSFPAWEGEELIAPPGFLGDIMICLPRAKEQAETYGHSLMRELCFLTVHGMLHLLGYDHMNEEDETEMREKQRAVMERIAL